MSRDQAAAILAEEGLPPDPDAGHLELPRELPDFDLGELASAGIQPPQMLAGGMLYAAGVHCVAGQPGGGKTTLEAWWMLQHIRDGGRVMLLDEESGPELMAEKFLDLGASPDELRPPRFSYVPFPSRRWSLFDVAQLHERIGERKPGIVAWDSAAAFLAIAGRDENSALEVTGFWQKVLVPCARVYGAAVLVPDHTGKGDHGGYGRGSGAKKAASDVQFIIETVRPFSRRQDGLLKLTTWPGKDRRGHLAAAYEIRVVHGPPLSLEITEAAAGSPASGERKMPPARAKLLEALEAIGTGLPVTGDQLVDWIAAKHGHGLKRQTVSTNLNELARDGFAEDLGLGGSHKLWCLIPRDADVTEDPGAGGWPPGSYGAEANQ